MKKEKGDAKPWSDNTTFQRTYFCNVRREHDTVTKFIRGNYSPQVSDPWFEFNIILSRFINWPDSLGRIGFIREYEASDLEGRLAELAKRGKVWGGAYVITTHGIPMGKAAYLCHNVLTGAARALGLHLPIMSNQSPVGPLYQALRPVGAPTLAGAHKALQGLEGLGSFLAAQVVADLKNTPGHPLATAEDCWTFVAPGPGSIRGLQWFWNEPKVTASNFNLWFKPMREFIDENWDESIMGAPICNQDLQNCLCEYDKFMRVSTASGKSKRNYPGNA